MKESYFSDLVSICVRIIAYCTSLSMGQLEPSEVQNVGLAP